MVADRIEIFTWATCQLPLTLAVSVFLQAAERPVYE